MSFKTDLEAVVLGTLQGQNLHGYEISKRISSKSEGLLRIGEGQLYPTLHGLEDQGLVTSEWIGQEGKPKLHLLESLGLDCSLSSTHVSFGWESCLDGCDLERCAWLRPKAT